MIFSTKKEADAYLQKQTGWYKEVFETDDGRYVGVVLRGEDGG